MGLIFDQLLNDATAFVDTDSFGESVTYINKAGATRTVNAFVDRGIVEPFPGAAPASLQKVTIWVINSASTGIASTELDKGDRVRLNAELDGVLVTKSINPQTADIDQGMLKLELM